MRHPRILVAVLTAVVALSGACGGADTEGPDAASTNAAAGSEAFPVTIEHRHGQTTIEARPERVVTVGLTDHDALLALGITPVGVTDWYGEHPHAVWPWAQDELGDAEPEAVGNAQELDLEKIAALEPDVILGLYSAMTEEQYETLSQIAPVVAQPDEHVDYGVPWQQLTRTVAEAVGEAEEADRLVTEVEDRIAAVRDDHPEFVGATAAIATPHEGVYVYSPEVGNVRLLRDLGLEVPDAIAELVGDADGAELSLERIDLLDTDVLVWLDAVPGEGPLGEELYTTLDVHQEGREIHVSSTDVTSGASFISVLSLPEILDRLVPMLAAAVDGDPSTEVPSVDEAGTGEATTAAFPVTIEHTHGATTIEARPERVVVVGIRDQDAVLALGVVPVAVRDWFGDQPDAVWPWAQDELGDADPVVLPAGEIDVEQVAALDPDVIIGVDSDLSEDQYALLSQVAPTVAPPAGFTPHAIPWRERTLRVAQALGEVERAEELIAEVEQSIEAAADAHPEFARATALVGLSASDGQAYAYGPEDVRSRFLVELGFSVPEVITEQVPDDSFFVTLSPERFGDLDADVLAWIGGGVEAFDTVTSVATYPQRVAEDGRDLFLPYDPIGGAMSFASVLSLPFLVDELVPELAAALDGDPTTTSAFGR